MSFLTVSFLPVSFLIASCFVIRMLLSLQDAVLLEKLSI